MSLIFEKIKPLYARIIEKFDNVAERIKENGIENFDWDNMVYSSKNFRRAHIEVLDRIESNNMWIMHVTVFPNLNDPSPIFGFDIVSTGKKVSGIFHDFSITVDEQHPTQLWFIEQVNKLTWKKERELPDWGKKIFSKNMIAAGSITSEEELEQIINTCLDNLDYYLSKVGTDNIFSPAIKEKQNYYCKCQKENPYPIKMLVNFGLTKEQAEEFVNNHLFPEV